MRLPQGQYRPDDHGTAANYRRGCRCMPCSAAYSVRYRRQARMERLAEQMRSRMNGNTRRAIAARMGAK